MNTITKSKWVYTKNDAIYNDIVTKGKVYEIITETAIDPFTSSDLTHNSFIGDNGISYLVDLNNDYFIPLDEWREIQLIKLI